MKIFMTKLLILLGSSFIGCQNSIGVEVEECPDTSISQANLDSLEADYIWRICNADEEYVMEEIETFNRKVDFQTLNTCTCSAYYSSEKALLGIDYKISGERVFPVYLDHFQATKGLIDTTEIRHTPGRYSYFFFYDNTNDDSSNNDNYHLEIKREDYHE